MDNKIIDVHKANVSGLGARRFVGSLCADLMSDERIKVRKLYMGNISGHENEICARERVVVKYRFGGLSRLTEICCWRWRRSNDKEILVLGDLPLNTRAKQYVLCHQSLIFEKFSFLSLSSFKFLCFRYMFKKFLKNDDIVLVQSLHMKSKVMALIDSKANVEILNLSSQFFEWPNFRRERRSTEFGNEEVLNLIYPAASYPHKNHHLLTKLPETLNVHIMLTLGHEDLSNHNAITNLGELERDQIYSIYEHIDGLLFLSSNESLGMPIIEAISCNLPIICPLTEYSENFKEDNLIFFEIDDPSSLVNALECLRSKLMGDWWPDWNLSDIFNVSKTARITEIINP